MHLSLTTLPCAPLKAFLPVTACQMEVVWKRSQSCSTQMQLLDGLQEVVLRIVN